MVEGCFLPRGNSCGVLPFVVFWFLDLLDNLRITMKRGYARVSTTEQDLGRQVHALTTYGCEIIYQEKISGTKTEREDLERLLSDLQPGDVVVVQKLDRLGRSLRHLLELINEFDKRKATFISISDNFDTTTAIGRMAFQIAGVFAEFERNMISERTKNALAHKKRIGVKLGRKSVFDNEELASKAIEMYYAKATIAAIAEECEICIPVVYKLLKHHGIMKNNKSVKQIVT